MSRSVNDIAIILIVAMSAIGALIRASVAAPAGAVALTLALLTSGAFGVLAVGAVVRSGVHARALTSLWAASVICSLVVEDVTAGFTRPGLTGRLLATVLVAALLAALVLSVPRRDASRSPRGVSTA